MAPPIKQEPSIDILYLGSRVPPCQPGTLSCWRNRRGYEKNQNLYNAIFSSTIFLFHWKNWKLFWADPSWDKFQKRNGIQAEDSLSLSLSHLISLFLSHPSSLHLTHTPTLYFYLLFHNVKEFYILSLSLTHIHTHTHTCMHAPYAYWIHFWTQIFAKIIASI